MSRKHLSALAERHMKAFCDGDVPTVMQDYAADARIITSQGVVEGAAAIRAMFEQNASSGFFANDVATTTFETPIVLDDEVAVVYWKTVNGAERTAGGIDVFVVREGKIVLQAASAEIVPVG